MALRDDWKRRIWQNKMWAFRALAAFAILSPLFLIEYVLHLIEVAVQGAYEKAGDLVDKWNEWVLIRKFTKSITDWVGKPGAKR